MEIVLGNFRCLPQHLNCGFPAPDAGARAARAANDARSRPVCGGRGPSLRRWRLLLRWNATEKSQKQNMGIQATGCDHWPTRRPLVGCETLQRRVRVRRVTNQRHLGLACITSRHDGLEWVLRPTSRDGHAQIAAHERDRGRAMTALQAAARESRTTHGPKLPAPDDLWRGPITRPRSASTPPLMAKPCGQSVP